MVSGAWRKLLVGEITAKFAKNAKPQSDKGCSQRRKGAKKKRPGQSGGGSCIDSHGSVRLLGTFVLDCTGMMPGDCS
jgi:hypothetical protein